MEKKVEKDYEKEFEDVRNLLHGGNNGKYNTPYILRRLHEKDNLRKTFLSVIKYSPARISEISEEALLTKPTCYSQLHKLMELHLVDRIYVLPIINGTVKNNEIKKKFEEWVKSMPDQLKRYYLAKTSYWVITDFGKKFSKKAYSFDVEFKEKEKEDGK